MIKGWKNNPEWRSYMDQKKRHQLEIRVNKLKTKYMIDDIIDYMEMQIKYYDYLKKSRYARI